MTTELTVHAVHAGGMRINARAGAHAVTMDYPRQPGEPVAGFTPLQLLLASLAGCSANTLALLLRRAEQPFTGLEVHARGQRREEHPTVLTEIVLEFAIHGAGVNPAVVERSLSVAEERICPVWSMLKDGTPISATYRIIA